MTKVVPYTKQHYELIELGEWHENEPMAVPDGPAVTFLVRETPVAIVGAYQVSPGVAHVWAKVSKNVDRNFARIAMTMLEHFMTSESIRRVQMSVRADYERGKRFARFLGFKAEGLMQKYGADGSNYWLYAKVKP